MTLLRKCIDMVDEYEFGRKNFKMKILKYVTYNVFGGNEWRNIQLFTSQVSNEYINNIFSFKL